MRNIIFPEWKTNTVTVLTAEFKKLDMLILMIIKIDKQKNT